MQTIVQAVLDLANARTTSRKLVEACLERATDPAGEGARTFTKLYAEQARTSADAMDSLRRVGRAPGPLAGIPISVKDLFDVAGEPTPAGSKILAGTPPAERHATTVARCLAAGLVPIGRTTMTEFAFSGLGINPHVGTPANPWHRSERRIPGGSSSGAAVSVADGMALAALGTDTGGSCRIPAAYCGIVGYKPTARRVPLDGVLPLSPTLDSVGPLARTVACCATIDAVLAGAPLPELPKFELRNLRLAVPANMVLEDMDQPVTEAFNRALNRLSNLGVRVTHLAFPHFEQVAEANHQGGFAPVEAFAWHRSHLASHAAEYDPRVRSRIERGGRMDGAEVVQLHQARRRIIASFDAATAAFDVVVMPATPLVPPRIDDLASDEAYTRANALSLRNAALANFLDRCAITIPMHREDEPPSGLMLVGETGADARLFAMAAAIEPALRA